MKKPRNKKQLVKNIGIIVAAGIFYYLQTNTSLFKNKVSLPESTQQSAPATSGSIMPKELIYTKHALCRMDCRKITKAEIDEVFNTGKLNPRKSDLQGKPCPTAAMEARTSKDQQLVRVVVANCPEARKVVTVIDLENKYNCHCK